MAGAAPASQPSAAPGTPDAAAEIVRTLLDRRADRGGPDPAALADLATAAKSPAATAATVAAGAWLDRNRAGVLGTRFPGAAHPVVPAQRFTLGEPADGPVTLYAHVLAHHASGKVIVYGLSGERLKRAYWLGEPRFDLKVDTTGRDAVVEVTAKNAKPPDPVATVVALDFDRPGYTLRPLTVPPRPDGSVLLHSRESIVVGRNLRYEPEPHKDTVGYWTNPADWIYWEFAVDKPGSFDVEMLQGCGKNSGGSEVEVTVDGGQPLSMTVQDTGHFQNFVPRTIGRVDLDVGTHTLAVKVKQKKGAAVMDLRQVTLERTLPVSSVGRRHGQRYLPMPPRIGQFSPARVSGRQSWRTRLIETLDGCRS